MGACSSNQPYRCIEGGILAQNSLVCGCTTGVPQTDATCSHTEDGIIIDNQDPDFQGLGDWELTTQTMGFYASDFLISYAGGNATATWTPDIPTAGYYKVYGWWRDPFSATPSSRATNATLVINHAGAQEEQPSTSPTTSRTGSTSGDTCSRREPETPSPSAARPRGMWWRTRSDSSGTDRPMASPRRSAGPRRAASAPLTVAFTDATTGDVDTWLWDFGDGQTSTLQNPSHEYTSAGQYTVSLTATGPAGEDTATQAGYIDVSPAPVAPVAAFSGTPTSGVAPLTVAFTDATTGDVDTWLWDFGDGQTSTLQNPSHEYTSAGQYTVSLTATGPAGEDTATQAGYIDVSPAPVAPVAAFSGTPTSGVAPLTVAFTDATTGDVDTWLWDFGDGQTSTLQNPSHEYTSAGQYTVSLTATGPAGEDTATQAGYIDVSPAPVAPVAAFSGTPTSGVAPLTVAFTDATTGDVDTWLWDFGDGQTSTLQNPSHEYTSAGQYTVSLTATGPAGEDTATQAGYIDVSPAPVAPVAAFSGTPTSGVAPLTVAFTDATTGDVDTWLWDFGDGQTSTLQNPSHEYTSAGQYTVSLTATGPAGEDTATQAGYIDVSPAPVAPVAAFSGTPTSGVAPLTVAFTDATTGDVDSWLWDFGDGQTSTLQNPSHEYTSAGQYTVSLTATGPAGEDTATQAGYIDVSPAPVAPVAAFSGTPTSGVAPLTVAFTDATTGDVDSWLWDFGDGQTSTLQNPSHEYTSAGQYTVSLTATGPAGEDTATQAGYIDVSPAPVAPVAAFSGTPTSGVAPLSVAFTDATTGDVDTWLWDFGDGQTSTLQNPSHEYTSAGQYTVSLTATGPAGEDTATQAGYIDVSPAPVAPVAAFSGTPTSGVAPLTVAFTDATTGDVDTWLWDFGDGQTSTLQNPSHEYTSAGQYTVSLTATGPAGEDTATQAGYIDVSPAPVAPVAAFSGTPTSGVAPLTVAFTDATTGDVDTWLWDFGDGQTSTLQNPSHEYTSAGQYTVSLTATGPAGEDTATQAGYIDVSPAPVAPVAAFSGTPTSGVAPLTVAFTDATTGDVDTWLWDFGDGQTSTLQNPSHEYTSAGQYTVSLTATGPAGEDTATQAGYIDVSPAPVAPVADVQRDPDERRGAPDRGLHGRDDGGRGHLAVGLRRRPDEHASEPEPRVHLCGAVHGEPDRDGPGG